MDIWKGTEDHGNVLFVSFFFFVFSLFFFGKEINQSIGFVDAKASRVVSFYDVLGKSPRFISSADLLAFNRQTEASTNN